MIPRQALAKRGPLGDEEGVVRRPHRLQVEKLAYVTAA
jgi:hypothetical protein